MSEQKKYIFTSDYTTLGGMSINKEGEVTSLSPKITISEIEYLLAAGILVDYQEPITSDKVEALEKELNDLKKKLTAAKKAKTKAQKDGDKNYNELSKKHTKCVVENNRLKGLQNKCAELESKKRKIADKLYSKQGIIECQYNEIKKKDETILKLYSEKHNNWASNEVAKDAATSKEVHVLSDGKGGIVKTKDPADYYRQCYKAEQERSLILKKRLEKNSMKIDCNPHQHATQQIQERFKRREVYTQKHLLTMCIILSTVSSIVSASLIVCFIFDNI